jgi:hypothetical protein
VVDSRRGGRCPFIEGIVAAMNTDSKLKRGATLAAVAAAGIALGSVALGPAVAAHLVPLDDLDPGWADVPLPKAPFDRLATAEYFTTDPLHPYLEAYSSLLSRPDDSAPFRRLAATGSGAGRVFGMCGLRATDPAAFAAHLPGLLGSTDTVVIAGGCEPAERPLAQIGSGIYSDFSIETLCNYLEHARVPSALLPAVR